MISLRQKSALQALHSPQPVVAVLVADEALDILGAGLDRKRMANVQLRAVFIDDLVELGVDLLTRLGIAQTAALLDQFVRLGIAEEGAVAGLALHVEHLALVWSGSTDNRCSRRHRWK